MNSLTQFIYKAYRKSQDQSGVIILQAIAVVVVSVVITATLVSTVLLDASAAQQNVIKSNSGDAADAGLGWASAWAVHAQIPLINTQLNSMTWIAPDPTTPSQPVCYKLYLDSSAKKLLYRQASAGSFASNCSAEIGAASDVTLVTGAVNTGSQSLFTFYSDTTNNITSRIADPTGTSLGLCSSNPDGLCAKSFDINLYVQISAAVAIPYAASYHVIFGGAVTPNLISTGAVGAAAIADNSLSTSKFQATALTPSSFDTTAIRTFSRVPLAVDSKVNYGAASNNQLNVWRGSATSRAATVGGATLLGGAQNRIVQAVDYRGYCVPGKQLEARANYTALNPSGDASGAIAIGARVEEYTGPNPTITPTSSGAALFTVSPQSVADGYSQQLTSNWIVIDDGSCSATNNYLSNSNPFYYLIDTKANVLAPYTISQASIELRYTVIAASVSAAAPNTPTPVSPGDGSFVGANPTLQARFTDPNDPDTDNS